MTAAATVLFLASLAGAGAQTLSTAAAARVHQREQSLPPAGAAVPLYNINPGDDRLLFPANLPLNKFGGAK